MRFSIRRCGARAPERVPVMNKTNGLSTTQTIMLAFLAAIACGSLLLALPVSAADGFAVPYIDALFTATTSVCVTGLVTVPTVSTWSVFGQAVILLLIQIGGLGVVTVMIFVMLSIHRKLGLGERMLIQEAFNLNTMAGLAAFTKKVLAGTFLAEAAGALLYMTVFVPAYGARGIWISVFNSISAFCNAGMDILSENSLCEYAAVPTVNAVTCTLVILGGIGFVVWWDVLNAWKNYRSQGRRCLAGLTLHSKIALSSTVTLLLAGTLLFFLFEYDNPATFRDASLSQKISAAFFQSVTTRTAGFAMIPQQNLTDESALVSLLLMFIGGSPTGTAGGIKTVTATVLVASAISTIRGRKDAVMFQRTVLKSSVSKAVAVVSFSFMVTFLSTLLLKAVTKAELLDVLYETVSATGTVGLSRNLTPTLNLPGKLIIIAAMYAGRVGPISLFIALNKKSKTVNIVKEPSEQISVG